MKLPVPIIVQILIFVCILSIHAYAQNPAPTHPVDGEYIKEWLVLGPFFVADLDRDFLVDMGGEANIHPKAGDTLATSEGKRLTWERHTTTRLGVDFNDVWKLFDSTGVVSESTPATAYAFCLLQSDADQRVEMRLRNADGIVVWVNGQRVYHDLRRNAHNPDENRVEVALRTGLNRCLVKVSRTIWEWEFVMRLATKETWQEMKPSFPAGSGKIVPVEEIEVIKASSGKTTPAGSGRGHWQNYGVTEGLAGLVVWSICRDKAGNLWFATEEGGVSRYDGATFTSFTTKDGLPNNQMIFSFVDQDGNLWFGSGPHNLGGGVTRYDGETFTTFTTKDGLAADEVTAICQDRAGNLWFGTFGSGVSRYDGQSFTTFTMKDGLAHNQVLSIYSEREGHLWFATFGGGVSRYDGKRFITFTTEDGLANNNVWSILQDAEGYLWFGTFNGVSRYDGTNFMTFTAKDGLGGNTVKSIFEDRDGQLWLGMFPGGVSRYDGEGFTTFTTKDGLVNDSVLSICQDRAGNLWFGTRTGVSRYNESNFVTFSEKDGLAGNSVNAILQDEAGNLWFATNRGASRYDGEVFTTFEIGARPGTGAEIADVWSMTRDRENGIWFTFDGGASHYDMTKEVFRIFKAQTWWGHSRVWSSYQDRSGHIWFGVWGRWLSRYDGEAFTFFTPLDGVADWRVQPILQDKTGDFWFGTFNGLCRYRFEPAHPTQVPEAPAGQPIATVRTFRKEDGLADNVIQSILEDEKGHLWLGTANGVNRYDGKTFTTFTTANGLAHNSVVAILKDRADHIWFATRGGVSRYDGQVFISLTHKDGLAGDNVTSIFQDQAGDFWFGTLDHGVARYHPTTSEPPRVFIDAVIADRRYEGISQVEIDSGVRLVAFEYHARSFKTRPEAMVYRYQLKGHDENWTNTKARRAEYQDLPEGNYTFELQAIDRDLNYSEPATLLLHVKRPWWVYALFGTVGVSIPLIALGFYFGKRLQTQRAIAQQFNPYIAGRVVGSDLFYGRSDILTDIERTIANNCFLIYGERRIGKSSLQHQLKERLSKADDPTYRFIPAYIDLQGVAEEDFCRTMATSIVEHAASLFKEPLALRLNEARDGYTYRDLTRDLRTIIDHLKANETKTIKLVLLMDEVDTLNSFSLRTNLNLRGLFMGPLKENLVLVMSGLYLKMDWSAEGGGSPPFNFLSREIQLQPLDEDSARKLITEPVKGFYTYEPKAVDVILSLSEFRPFTIQGFCLRAVNRILADGRTKITVADIEAIKDSVLAEVASIRGERAGTSLPASFNEAITVITELKAELAKVRGKAA